MFNRSGNRTTTHTTAYTGVNQSSVLNSQQPNSNALAAALSIGKSLQLNSAYKKPGMSVGRANSLQAQRTYSIQNKGSNGSLLKRNSILRKSSNNSVSEFGDFSNTLISDNKKRNGTSSNKLVYDIDDTMNDSYFDEVTDEAQEYYNNHANMKDLKLSYKPEPQSYRMESLRSKKSGNSSVSEDTPVRMVKKYIPTPNGIKVIEVPESNIAREFARSNSIRSGRNISRSASMNSISAKSAPRLSSLVSNGQRQTKRVPSRLSSLANSPNMSPMLEDVELETSLGKEDEFKEQALKYENLEKQIEHEKQMSKQLELKALEYEKLKRLRIENENKLLALQREVDDYELIDKEAISEDVSDNNIKINSINKDITQIQESPEIKSEIEKPLLTSLDQQSNRSSVYDEDEGEDEGNNNGDFILNELQNEDDTDKTNKDQIYEEVNSDEIAANSTIDASSVVVDEFEKKEIEEEVTKEFLASDDALKVQDINEQGSIEDNNYTNLVSGSNIELKIINSYNNSLSNESLKRDSMIHPLSDSESENNDKNSEDEGSNLANQLRPTFDNVPKIIDNEIDEPISTLEVPNSHAMKSSNSSINSANTDNSTKNKPMKSAMKNSRSFINSTSSSNTDNPAHQAYLSLTTAENTRLNSKLSSGQLDSIAPQIVPLTIPQSTVQSNKPKRMSSSLRNSVPVNPSAINQRTLRPQSAQFSQEQVGHNGMSNKTLRNKPYVQPISLHPTLQPNYASPSKVRAAELYAKANARSSSVFAPIKRRSSYVRDDHKDIQDSAQQMQNIQQEQNIQNAKHKTFAPSNTIRKSLRDAPPQSRDFSSQSHPQQNFHRKNDSMGSAPGRFDDNYVTSNKKFTSRIADSDDEISNYNSSYSNIPQKEIPSLRTSQNKQNNNVDDKSSNQKEKKKFGKLRKLFGRNS